MKLAFFAIAVVHGLIHLLGFAKGLGLAQLPQLQLPISRAAAGLWFVSAALLIAGAALLFAAPRYWGVVLLLGAATSQVLIFRHFQDAKFGTFVNLLLLLPALVNAADLRPTSLRSEYLTATRRVTAPVVSNATPAPSKAHLVNESDLAALPEPVQRNLRRVGAVGKPRVRSVRALQWTSRSVEGLTSLG